MAKTVSNYFRGVEFHDVMSILALESGVLAYSRKGDRPLLEFWKEVVLLYYWAFQTLCEIQPSRVDPAWRLEVKGPYSTGGMDITLRHKFEQETYGIDCIPWNEVLGYRVKKTGSKSDSQIVAYILWELTFHTYTEDTRLWWFEEESDPAYAALLAKSDADHERFLAWTETEDANTRFLEIMRKLHK